jgi:cytochrome o ubiquinol oxidase operon protein cyoD
VNDGHAHTDLHHDGHSHGTRRGYLVGFGLSALLTAIPFWLAMSGAMDAHAAIPWVISLAFVQIAVHTFSFLHVNTRAEGGWTLLAFVFTFVVGAIAISGSLWIMYHLNANMMPMAPGSLPSTP